MFQFSKHTVNQTTEDLAQTSQQAVEEIANQVKSTASDLLEAVQTQTDAAEDKAEQLIRKLKQSIAQLTHEHADDVQHLGERAIQWKQDMQHQVGDTLHDLKNSTQQTVQQHPLGTVLVAAGAGLLLGYLLSKHR